MECRLTLFPDINTQDPSSLPYTTDYLDKPGYLEISAESLSSSSVSYFTTVLSKLCFRRQLGRPDDYLRFYDL